MMRFSSKSKSKNFIVVFSAEIPSDAEQHLRGEQQHHHLPRPHRHHIRDDWKGEEHHHHHHHLPRPQAKKHSNQPLCLYFAANSESMLRILFFVY